MGHDDIQHNHVGPNRTVLLCCPVNYVDMCTVCSGIGAQNIFELLSQFKRGDCDGTKVRLGRLQVYFTFS